jgi:hypothetical protein
MMNFSAGAADFFVMLPMQIFAGGVYFRFRPESAYFRIFFNSKVAASLVHCVCVIAQCALAKANLLLAHAISS